MSGLLLLGGVAAVHLALLVGGFLGGSARLLGGIGVIAINYGLRRLLFLDPALGASHGAWLGLILLGDLTLVLLVAMSAVRPSGSTRLHPADGAVVVLALTSVVLALADVRVPSVVRLAHWKEEYLYLVVYALARLNGPGAAARPGGPGGLGVVAVLGVGLALWQALAGPLPLDIAWIRSGHSLLTEGGEAAIAGAHGLGNLAQGYLRPYGFFGNGTDYGVFLAFVGLWAIAARLPGEGGRLRPLAAAGLRPLPLLCLLGVLVGVVRFTWAVWALGLLVLALMTAGGGRSRALRLWGLGTGLGVAAMLFLALAPVLGGSGSLVGRAFVTGTYADRLEGQGAYLTGVAEAPSRLLTGDGFGAHGAAARKFLPSSAVPAAEPHSRAIDLLRDGGLGLLLATLAPLILAGRGGIGGEPVRAAMLAFVWGLMICAILLGAKSALLQTLTWGALGMAVSRAPPRREPREVPACG